MKYFDPFCDDNWSPHTLESSINPASGMPMIEGSCIDIEGNMFGTDSSSFDSICGFGIGCGIGSMFDD